MAPLQKRALYSLIIGLILTAIFVIVLVMQGDVTVIDRDLGIRMYMYLALVGVPLVCLILMKLTLRKPGQVDERDSKIVEKSRDVQWISIIFALAAWTITLTEVYRSQGNVPIVFVNLIFVSILILSNLAQSAGILLGYWSQNRNG